METTEGTLLGGRVRYAQPAHGFRSGIEPVLLAAAVPAAPGAWVLEAGAGAGAGLLCLGARVALGFGVGVERDPALAALAARNAAANALPLGFVAADILTFRPERRFDHAFANPPYHATAGTASPERRRKEAKLGPPGLVTEWAASLGDMLHPGGTLSLILPPARLVEALEGCARARCGSIRLLPLWPKLGREAKLVILQAVRDHRGPLALLSGRALHRPDGGFTDAAEAVLRVGLALPWGNVTSAADRNME